MSRHYVTVEEIQAGTGWSRAYVYKLASMRRWRRLPVRPVRYHLDDVMGGSGQECRERRTVR